MAWWKIALIGSVVWLVLILSAAYVHVEVLLSGQLTEEQEDVLGMRYGLVAGTGLPLIWAVALFVPIVLGPPQPKIDRGFCFVWWRLSPRRQFLREFWAGGLCVGLFVAWQASGNFPNGLREMGFSNPVSLGWWIAGVIVAGWIVWVAFLYRRWKRIEARETPATGPAS